MVGTTRKLLIAFVVGLFLGTVAPALATPTATPSVATLPRWKPHKKFLRRLDRMVGDLHVLATSRGFDKDRLQGMSPIQLTGSSVYRLPAFARRGQLPTFEDFDMRMVGVTLPELTKIVTHRFPQVVPQRDIEVGPSYLAGILHVQVKLKGRQLDLSLYENAEAYLAPHQRLTMAALKLNLEPDTRLNWILPRLAVEHEATGMRDQQVLEDPGQSGLEDARAGLARTYYVPGMDRMRRPEGLLHAAYWVGKSGDRIKIEPYTMDEFRRLSPTAILEFFNDPEKGVAIRRRNYVLSTLRVKDGRDPLRVIEMLRQADALPKLFPGMDKVLGDADKWARATARVRRLNAHVRRSLKGQDIRQAREQVVAALLSEVDDIEKALSIYQWSKAPRGDDFNKHRIITAWKWFRTSDPNPVAPDPSPSEQPAPQD